MVKIDVCIPYIFVEDAAAMRSSVLSNLCVKFRDDISTGGRRTFAKYSNAKRAAFFLSSSLRAICMGFLV